LDNQKKTQWRAFLAKNALKPVELKAVLSRLRLFLEPPMQAARLEQPWAAHWHPDVGWR
jgi:hypothetical protein